MATTNRVFSKALVKDCEIRQHSDGRISIFFSEDCFLHTIYLKKADVKRRISCKLLKSPKEISTNSLYSWCYWEEVDNES